MMEASRKTALTLTIAGILAGTASAGTPLPWVGNLRMVAYSLGWLMMVLMGVKWIVADSPNERADAKKSMIYVIIGLLVVASACGLLQIYCNNAAQSFCPGPSCASFTCNPATYCGP